ncbi:MAG: hypothetical protein J6I85_00250 [Clostridia bacterium]|nr:hypothetical protein [Clostridia bacterium]
MKKLINKYKKIIIIYEFIFVAIVLAIREILLAINIDFMNWEYIIFGIIAVLGFLAGTIQLIIRIRDIMVKAVFIAILLFLVISISPLAMLSFSLICDEKEQIVTIDNTKMVLHNVGFEKKEMFYFDYINIFMRGKNKKIYEYLNRDGTQGRIYYDDNGNIIKEEQSKDESIEATYNPKKEELQKQLNNYIVTYDIMQKGAKEFEEIQKYIDKENKLKALQERLEKTEKEDEIQNIKSEFESIIDF